MKISISSVKFKADKRLEDFIQDKIGKLATNYDNLISGEVTLRLDNSANQENKIAEIRLNIPGNDLFAKKQCKTFEEATDSALDALRKQLSKHKEKIHP
ncbi:MAG: ribosome-associated translation inhibitor RaiA [Bacteroidales bacterium]|jgi:putative sigma-54 modulation protein|nr:ribosome-associated translation inhibitor RaiA [Bacteroidales bacterium]HPB01743.1 ribosome-associated translation inhibitor RaiA [Bacteroidales bacterium]